jgi:biotin transporter BioY
MWMWSTGVTLLVLLLVFVRAALGDACVLTMGSQYQLKSDTVDWTMQTSSAHSTASMGQSREGTPSNSNFLAALHSGLEQAHEVRGGP